MLYKVVAGHLAEVAGDFRNPRHQGVELGFCSFGGRGVEVANDRVDVLVDTVDELLEAPGVTFRESLDHLVGDVRIVGMAEESTSVEKRLEEGPITAYQF